MCRFFIVLFFCTTQTLLIGQDSFSQKALQSFANIYMAQKDLHIDKQSEMLTLMDEYQLSKERYREIMQKSLKGADLKLSDSEKSFIDAIRQLSEAVVVEKKTGTSSEIKGIKQLCEKHDLAYTDYTTILKLYKSDIEFQHSLKLYFETIIKRNR